jgi:transposase
MKVLYFDGTGLCVLYKRLDAGTFKFPLSYDGDSSTLVLSERELETLFSGIDIDLPTRH